MADGKCRLKSGVRKEICMSIGKGAVRCAAWSVIHVGVAGAHYLLFAALSMLLNRRLGVPPVRARAESAEKCENKRKTPAYANPSRQSSGEPGQHHAALLTHAALVVGSNYIPAT